MKRTTLFMSLIAILFIAGTTSCSKKDGVYNPKQKISKIYTESVANGVSSNKQLSETWTWSDNKLTQISYPSGSPDVMTYNSDNQLTSVVNGDFKMNFTYDGSKLKTIELYEGSTMTERTEVSERDGSNVTKLSGEVFETPAKNVAAAARLKATGLQLVFPGLNKESLKQNAVIAIKKAQSKANMTYTVVLTYSKDNVSTEEWRYSDGSVYSHKYNSYDSKNNPYYGSLAQFGGFFADIYSKNNMTADDYTETEDGTAYSINYTFTYDYDGDWPTTATMSYVLSSVTYKGITYYEY